MNTLHPSQISLLLAASLSASLCACGGSDTPPDLAAKYEGQWSSTCYAAGDSVYRYQELITLKRTGDASIAYEGAVATFTDAHCEGATSDLAEYTGVIALKGDKPVEDRTADRVEITPTDQESIKNLIVLAGGLLYVGKKEAAVDTEGYPASIETAYRFDRKN